VHGFVLRNSETEALQYHNPSANKKLVLEQPFLKASQEDLNHLHEQLAAIDFLEWMSKQCDLSKEFPLPFTKCHEYNQISGVVTWS